MTYQLLALDLDGTLFTSKGTITDRTKTRIADAQQSGVLVTLATGRHHPFAKSVAKELKIDVPIITHDGAYIAHPQEVEPYFVQRISYQTVIGIIRILRSLRIRMMVLHEKVALTNSKMGIKEILAHLGQLPLLKHYVREKYHYQYTPDQLMIEHIQQHEVSPPKLFIMGDRSKMKRAKDRLEQHFADEVRMTTSGHGIEILPVGISKAYGLYKLMQKLDIPREAIIAVGDQYNDLEMLQYAGVGVAMGNAPKAIQQAADYVTYTNNEDGVAYVIERLILD